MKEGGQSIAPRKSLIVVDLRPAVMRGYRPAGDAPEQVALLVDGSADAADARPPSPARYFARQLFMRNSNELSAAASPVGSRLDEADGIRRARRLPAERRIPSRSRAAPSIRLQKREA